jgi:hypothetical protein
VTAQHEKREKRGIFLFSLPEQCSFPLFAFKAFTLPLSAARFGSQSSTEFLFQLADESLVTENVIAPRGFSDSFKFARQVFCGLPS